MEANTVAMEAAREFLGRARELRREIENKQRRIQTLRDMATSATGTMSDMPRSDSPNLQRMETVLLKAADLEMEVAGDMARLDEIKQEITAAVCEMPDYREQQALYFRYVDCLPWAEISTQTGFHRRTLMKWHESGMVHFGAMMHEKTFTSNAHPEHLWNTGIL